jgi:hypothetical protein
MLTKGDELRDRVEARKHELMAKLHDLKADTRKEARAQRDHIQHSLEELEAHIKNGWEKIDNTVRAKLDKWLAGD